MLWKAIEANKEAQIKTCFALFPKKIGQYVIWLQRYYKTWDWAYMDVYSGYFPRYFISKEAAIAYVRKKKL